MKEYIKKFKFFIGYLPRRKLILFVVATLVLALMDLTGIISVGAFASILVDGKNSRIVEFLRTNFALEGLSDKRYILYVGSFLVGVFFVKAIFSCLLQRWILLTTKEIETILAKILGRTYLEMSYEKSLRKDKAFMESILHSSGSIGNFLQHSLQLVVNGIFVVAISIMLLCIYPIMFICFLTVILTAIALYYNLIKGKINNAANTRVNEGIRFYQYIKDIFSSFKEIKIYLKEDYFFKEISTAIEKRSRAEVNQNFFSIVPKYIIEFVLISFVVFISFLLFFFNKDSSYVLQSLGVFSASFARLIPVVNMLTTSLIEIKGSLKIVDLYYQELQINNEHVARDNFNHKEIDLAFKGKVLLKSIEYTYPSSHQILFKELDLEIIKNECVGLVGPSGSGKSTFIDILTGLLPSKKGKISLGGISIYENIRSWRNNFAYIPQNILLINNTIARNIALGLSDEEIDFRKINESLKKAELYSFVKNLPEGVHTKVGDNGILISGGQRQRVAIARALYQDKEILILDEATSALDPKTERKILNTLKNINNKTLIVISHNYESLDICDRIFEIKNNNIYPRRTFSSLKVKTGRHSLIRTN